MLQETAERIATKTKALKHCTKLIEKIDREGSAIVKLNCSGVRFVVEKGDPFYLKLVRIKAELAEEIRSFEVVRAATTERQPQIPPVAAAPVVS